MSYPNQPYGAPYGDRPPPGYGYPPPGPRNDGLRTTSIIALVLNLVATVSCCNFLAIPGAIMAGLALGKVDSEPENARSRLLWSWILFGSGFVLTIALFIVLGVNGAFDD
ncbi:hypothetical protein [Nonomuraea typhae]|uniref:hypothetical protein n=1 Tax=Nonomuraea typhae TaxID=2603600 RepID=UPI0012FC6FF6|nr:hypothetical protein [Nonomuraea typhae]